MSLSRVDVIVRDVAARLSAGIYKAGERLPSIRQAARDHGVSKNTMAEAYDRLVARGVLEARPGSGYYAIQHDIAPPAHVTLQVDAALDLVSMLREQLEQRYEVRPGDGRPPTSWTDSSALKGSLGGPAKSGRLNSEDGYGSPWGFAPLRHRLRVLLSERSIAAEPDGLLLTHGANHALDLIIRHLIEPGDTVFVDEPGYYPLFGKLTLSKARVVGIRRGRDGPDLDDMDDKLKTYRPKMFFTQSLAQNPTGSTLSPSCAFGLMRRAEQQGFLLVENDPFADLLPASLPRLASLDQLNRVLYIGTFSKTLSASLRVGFVAGHPTIIGALNNLKMLTTVTTSDYVERVVHELIERGRYLRHLRRLRARVENAYNATAAALEGLGLDPGKAVHRGFYLWVELPPKIDERDLCHAAAERSIFLAPGSVFSPRRGQEGRARLRVNVAYGTDDRFVNFLRDHIW